MAPDLVKEFVSAFNAEIIKGCRAVEVEPEFKKGLDAIDKDSLDLRYVLHLNVTAVEQAGMGSLAEGQKVAFDIQPDDRGPKAVNLQEA